MVSGDRPGTLERPEAVAGAGAAATLVVAGLGATFGTGAIDDGPVMCPFRAATGLPCPFCGLTRSVYALGDGDLAHSLELSPLGIPAVVLAIVALALLLAARSGRLDVALPRAAGPAVVALVAISWATQLDRAVT